MDGLVLRGLRKPSKPEPGSGSVPKMWATLGRGRPDAPRCVHEMGGQFERPGSGVCGILLVVSGDGGTLSNRIASQMSWWLLDGLRASRRFGKAVRKQEANRLTDAYRELVELDGWFDSRARQQVHAPPLMSVRLMTLVHLAEVAEALGEKRAMEAALQKWLSEYGSVCVVESAWSQDELMQRWEKWVRAKLQSQSPARE